MAALAALVSLLGASAAGAEIRRFGYTGAEQTFTVPAGVTRIAVTAVGGEGGSWNSAVSLGATVTGSLSVTPGEVLSLIVAGNGEDGNGGDQGVYHSGGFGGGGRGAGGGGGATSIRGSTLLLVAGGGGGAGEGPGLGLRGGNAGEPGLRTIELGRDCVPPDVSGGGAGTSSAGGLGGTGCHQAANGGDGQAWASGVSGGEGGSGDEHGGGGGGGYWGGAGGGGWNYAHGDEEGGGIGLPGSGGGGSSLVPAGGTEGIDEDGAPPQTDISWTGAAPSPIDVPEAASGITQTSATLNATVNPDGETVSECRFEYGTTASYGQSASCSSLPGSGESPVAVSASVSGLSPNTTYHFSICATNASGASCGADETFKTTGPPAVVTGSASSITQTTATLNATVNPDGETVSECRFEYGTTASYGQSASCSSLPGSGSRPVAVSASVSGLSPNTTYHFRISATTPGGESKGAGETFKTPGPPAVVTESASEITQTTAKLNATVNPDGETVSECKFEYGTTVSYGQSASCSQLPSPLTGSGSSPVAVSAPIGALTAHTYHFRISATNAGGTSSGPDQTFTTRDGPYSHWYKNGTRAREGAKVPTLGWGTLTLTSSAGALTCHTVTAGYVENPLGGGPGVSVTQSFNAYECSTAECPAESRLEAYALPWTSELEEATESPIRSKTPGVDLVSGCWLAAPSGPGNASPSERGEPIGALTAFTGEWSPKLKNGTKASTPSRIEFGAGSGELINRTVGLEQTTGSTTLLGFDEQEVITASTP